MEPKKQPAKKKTKRKPRLDERQKKFAKGLAKGLPTKKAAEIAGYAPSVAKSSCYALQDNPKIVEEIQDIRARNLAVLARMGCNHETRIAKSISLLEAKKTILAFDDLHEVPDSATQLAALKDVHKLAGDYPADRLDVEVSGGVRVLYDVDPLDIIDITPGDGRE